MYCDDEDSVSSNNEEQKPSSSRDADYLLSSDSSNHKITEGELNDPIRDLERLMLCAALIFMHLAAQHLEQSPLSI